MRRMLKGLDSHEIIVRTRRILSMQRAIATIVLIAMVLSMIPFQVFASDDEAIIDDRVQTTETEKIKNYDIDKKDIPIVAEDTSRRTESEKHFRKQDGSYEVVLYDGAVHYQDGDEWLDIDNTLDYDDDSKTYKNKANKFDIKFPKDITNQDIKLKMSDYEIDWQFIGTKSSEASIKVKDDVQSDDMRELYNINEEIIYHDVLDGIDLSYTLSGSKIKEAFIVENYQEDLSFSFEYTLKNLSLIETDEGIILVDENGKTQFTFDSLIMFDSESIESNVIDINIEQTKKDTYIITITPSDEWLQQASYPVTIDPTLDSSTTSMYIYDTYVSSSYPDSKYYNQATMAIGGTSSIGQFNGLIYFRLPTTVSDQTITYANLSFTKYSVVTGAQINVYQNTENFSSASATWNNAPSHENSVIDYYTGNSSTPCMFDITESVKEWQADGLSTVPGFTLILDDNIGSLNSVYQKESTANAPIVSIGYEDPTGLKDYWTYTAQDMGALGTGYISDYTGNLTWVRNDYSLDNEYLPLTLNMYYSYAKRTTNIGYGYGWKTNYDMEITYDSNLGQYYLESGDGSKVYFVQDVAPYESSETEMSEEHVAEDGSNRRLFITKEQNDVTSMYIKTTSDYVYDFDADLFRLSSIDNNANQHSIRIYYVDSNSNQFSKIEDEVGNKITFDYDDDDLLEYTRLYLIQSDDTFNEIEKKYYMYDSYDNLDTIEKSYDYDKSGTFSSANELDYSFNSSHQFNNAENSSSGYAITYGYLSNGKVNHVETSDSSLNISDMDISYDGNQTTYTNYDGEYVKYLFDDYGHTVNILDSYGNTQSFRYAKLFTYKTAYENQNNYNEIINYIPNYYIVHHLVEQSEIIKQQHNPVVNHGFEEGDLSWEEGPYGSVDVTNDESVFGDSAMAITCTGTTAYTEQDVYLKAGYHTISGYIKNSGAGSSTVGAYIDIIGETIPVTPEKVYDNDEWVNTQLTFFISSDKFVTIRLYNQSTSTAYFDNIQINEGFNESRYNTLSNASFEYTSSSWTTVGSNVSLSSISETGILDDILGSTALKIVGDGGTYAKFYQTVQFPYIVGETYIFSGWAKADAVPAKAYAGINDDDRFFGLYLTIEFYIEDEGSDFRNFYLPFDTSIETWQYQSYAITLPEYDEILNVNICGFYRGEGTAYFDNIQFYHDDLTTGYDYNSSGDLTGIIYPDGSETEMDYDDDHHLTEITADNQTTNIEYTSGYLVEEVEQNNVRVTNEYDSSTHQLISQFYGYDKDATSQEEFFKTSITYELDSQYIHTQTDEFGNTYTYNTDEETGLISNILDPLNHQVSYTYTDFGQLETQTFVNSDGNVVYHYTYDSNLLLTSITVEEVAYIFDYDDLGRIENILIDHDVSDVEEPEFLVGYTYITETVGSTVYETDLIETKSYANGDVYTFEYTEEDQLESVYFNTETEARVFYVYDSSGRLAIAEDIYNNDVYYYSYDLAGRLEKITDQSGNIIEYVYDENGNIVNYTYNISGVERGVTYNYNEQTGEYDFTAYLIGSTTYKKEYNYNDYNNDSLKRLHDLTLKVDNNSILTVTYNYDDSRVDINMGTATFRTYSIIYDLHETGDDFSYYYFYDDNQNIIQINIFNEDNQLIEKYNYEYNELNYLSREDIRNYSKLVDEYDETNCSTYYAYDQRGNITSIEKYPYGKSSDDEEIVYVPATNPYTPYIENYGYYSLDAMYNSAYYYDDVYEIDLNETPTFTFLFYDLDNQQIIYENQLYVYYDITDIDSSVAGYYLMDVTAVYPGYYELYFSVMVKVGNPVVGVLQPIEPESTVTYNYDDEWKDQLESYTIDGVTSIIAYDDSGNPTRISNFYFDGVKYNHATLVWEGRRLISITIQPSPYDTLILAQITYTYNDQGVRTSKLIDYTSASIPDEYYEYILDGDLVLVEIKNGTAYVYYTYDVDGKPISMTYGGDEYFYVYDLQGNVIGLIDDTGELVVEYKYDAWGNIIDITNSTLAEVNPYRYRGYRYDEEIGYYYLLSRYYNPEIARFISMDDVSFLTAENAAGINLYAYCANNPVMYSDISGYAPEWLKTIGIVGGIVGAVFVVTAITVLTCGVGTSVMAGTLAGAVIHGAAVGTLIGAAAGIGLGATAGAVGSLIAGEQFGSDEFWSNTGYGALAGFGIGAVIGAISGGVYSYSTYVPSQITGYTRHGLRQAMSRNGHGVSPKGVLDAVKNPTQKVIRQANGGYKFVGQNSVTILNKAGKVITTWSRRVFWRF